jgi:hypothetical protein
MTMFLKNSYLFIIIFILFGIYLSDSLFFSTKAKSPQPTRTVQENQQKNKLKASTERFLLPKLIPQYKEFLWCFLREGDPECEVMKPFIKKLQDEVGLTVQIFPADSALYREVYKAIEETNYTVPTFYNRKSGAFLYGSTPYRNLLRWALGSHLSNPILPLPMLQSVPPYLYPDFEKYVVARQYRKNVTDGINNFQDKLFGKFRWRK